MSSSSPFKGRVGLLLSGGGALCSWQIGALAELERRLGRIFSGAIGFSAGAINAAAYALGVTGAAFEEGMRIDRNVLRFSPRLAPLSLFSDRPLRKLLSFLPPEEQARRQIRSRLVVVSASYDRQRLIHAVFEPGGRWDGPLMEHLIASCAIPVIFPPVKLPFKGREVLAVDGGVWCPAPLLIKELGALDDVLVLEMVRPDEPAPPPGRPIQRRYWHSREMCRRAIDGAVAALGEGGPRVFRFWPSQRLELETLHFIGPRLRRAADLGRRDVDAFLASPDVFLSSKK